MIGTPIIDVAIGLTFTYLLVSMMLTVIAEIVASAVSLRGRTLRAGLRRLLSDGHAPEGAEKAALLVRAKAAVCAFFGMAPATLTDRIYDHPLVQGLEAVPSYIPARTFAPALLDLIVPKGERPDSTTKLRALLARADANAFPDGMKDQVLRTRQAALALLDGVDDDLAQGRARIETWFDDSMDRVSAVYKQKTQRILLFAAILLAVAFNIDSVKIASRLWRDPIARAAVIKAAEEVAKGPRPVDAAKVGLASTTEGHAGAGGTAGAGVTQTAATGRTAATTTQTAEQRIDEIKAGLVRLKQYETALELTLPIGWTPLADGETVKTRVAAAWRAIGTSGFLAKIAGWLITALATSLGAPFWFDTLNRFMSIRHAGTSPREKGEREAKERKEAAR